MNDEFKIEESFYSYYINKIKELEKQNEKIKSLLGKLVCAVEDSIDSDNWNYAKKAYIENLDEILESKKGV